MKNTREIGSQTGTTKVSIVPLISATTPNSVPTAFVTGTSIVSIHPAAPAAMGLPFTDSDQKRHKYNRKHIPKYIYYKTVCSGFYTKVVGHRGSRQTVVPHSACRNHSIIQRNVQYETANQSAYDTTGENCDRQYNQS